MKIPLAITMGDPSGVGPEVIVKALSRGETGEGVSPLVVGDAGIIRRAAETLNMDLEVRETDSFDAAASPGIIPVLPVSNLDPDNTPFGSPTGEGAKAALAAIDIAVSLAVEGKAAGVVTAPISKEALSRVGFSFPGHTEYLASLTGVERSVMLMAGPGLKVSLATVHIPLAAVAGAISRELILDTIRVTREGLMGYFGHKSPRLAVAGLNPHAGEGGLFGDEEKVISAAVRGARDMGWSVTGPVPPDTVFFRAAEREFDAVVAMYHDQGLIPFKLLHFHDGVNVTLGLPVIRTSVDHGTAFDIAGSGVAREDSLVAAITTARDMALNSGWGE